MIINHWSKRGSPIRTYAVYEDPHPHETGYDIFIRNGDGSLTYYLTFQDPKYLDEKMLTGYLCAHLRARTSLAG